jgi:hypothetical protein
MDETKQTQSVAPTTPSTNTPASPSGVPTPVGNQQTPGPGDIAVQKPERKGIFSRLMERLSPASKKQTTEQTIAPPTTGTSQPLSQPTTPKNVIGGQANPQPSHQKTLPEARWEPTNATRLREAATSPAFNQPPARQEPSQQTPPTNPTMPKYMGPAQSNTTTQVRKPETKPPYQTAAKQSWGLGPVDPKPKPKDPETVSPLISKSQTNPPQPQTLEKSPWGTTTPAPVVKPPKSTTEPAKTAMTHAPTPNLAGIGKTPVSPLGSSTAQAGGSRTPKTVISPTSETPVVQTPATPKANEAKSPANFVPPITPPASPFTPTPAQSNNPNAPKAKTN